MKTRSHLAAVVLFGSLLAACGGESPQEAAPGQEGPSQAPPTGGAPDPATATTTAAPSQPAQSTTRSPAPIADKAPPQPPSTRTGHRDDPDGTVMNWVFVDWTGVDPELEATAAMNVPLGSTYNGTKTNEFNHQKMVAQELARLQKLVQASTGVATVTTNVRGALSEYDFNYGEFYVSSLSPGSTIQFGFSREKNVKQFLKGVELANALEGYVWKVPPEQAEQIIRRFEEDRNTTRQVYSRISFTIEGATAKKGLLHARMTHMALFTDPNFPGKDSTPLMERTF